MRNFISASMALLIILTVFNISHAHDNSDQKTLIQRIYDADDMMYWVALGGGFPIMTEYPSEDAGDKSVPTYLGGNTGFYFSPNGILVFGYSANNMANVVTSYTNHIESLHDTNYLIGIVIHSRWRNWTFATGPGSVRLNRRKMDYSDGSGQSYTSEKCSTTGLAVEVNGLITPLPVFGLGLKLYGNFNNEANYFGIHAQIAFGWYDLLH